MDFLNVGSNQRIDADDFNYGMNMAQINASRIVAANALTTQSQWVVNGFTTGISTSNAKAIMVQGGTAFLSWRNGATVVNGMTIAPPDGTGGTAQQVSQTLDLSTYAAGTYGVYIRFNFTPTAYQSRTFWGTVNGGSEYAQATATRNQAVWELRVETNNPGSEWLLIAQVTVNGDGSLAAPVDKRPLFYEGSGGSPAYANTWGNTTDRSSNRALNPVGDLKTFVDAMHTCLEDIKGPGLQRWYSRGIGGMNIGAGFVGPSYAPLDGRIALGDSGFYLAGVSAGSPAIANPTMAYNANVTSGGSWVYNRAADQLAYYAGGVASFGITSGGAVGIGTAALAPQATLHVAGAGGLLPARFDGASGAPGSMTTVQIVGYNANDPTYLSFGDSIATSRRSVWHLGQLGAGLFGLTSAGTSPTVYWQYNSATSMHSFAGSMGIGGSFLCNGLGVASGGAQITGAIGTNEITINSSASAQSTYGNPIQVNNGSVGVFGCDYQGNLGVKGAITQTTAGAHWAAVASGGGAIYNSGDLMVWCAAKISGDPSGYAGNGGYTGNATVRAQAGQGSGGISAKWAAEGSGQSCLITFPSNLPSNPIVLITPEIYNPGASDPAATSNSSDTMGFSYIVENANTIYVKFNNFSGIVTVQFNILILGLGL